MSRVTIYLKQDDSYLFLASARSDMVTHKGVEHRVVIFDWFTSRLLEEAGIRSAHLTYPDNGEQHLTYEFPTGIFLHLSADRMNLTWSRDIKEPPDLPNSKLLQGLNYNLQRTNAPAFDSFKPETTIFLLNSGMLVPYPAVELLHPKKTAKARWEIIDTAGLRGTLNLHPFVSGSPEPVIAPSQMQPLSFEKTFVVGSEAPFFGFLVRIIPPESRSPCHPPNPTR